MATSIHARFTNDGLRFRRWTTEQDCYFTDELTEEELRKQLVEEAIARAREEIEKMIGRAKRTGTSIVPEISTSLLATAWKKELAPFVDYPLLARFAKSLDGT